MKSSLADILAPVTDTADHRKLNAIVGSALRALADSGADSEAIGEFAVKHREEVARILGVSQELPQAPDLHAVVAQALSQALADAGIGTKRSSKKERVFVFVAGRKTSVTLQTSTVEKVEKVKGSKREAKSFIQELASRAPVEATNRSGWIEERLQSFLSYSHPFSSDPKHH